MAAQKMLKQQSRAALSGSGDGSFTDVPVTLLESFLPGFGIVRRLIVAAIGFDITLLVSTCFIAFAIFTSARYLWRLASTEVMRWFTSTIAIQSKDKLHDQVMYWISKQRVTDTARRLTAKTRGSQWEELDGQMQGLPSAEPFNFSDWDSSIPPIYAPNFGSHWFTYKGRLFFFRRDQGRQNALLAVNSDNEEERETIRISCLGRSTEPIKELLHACKKAFTDSKRALTIIRHPAQMARNNWNTATRRPSRPMNTVYLDKEAKEELINDARDFLHPLAPRFYARRGIPYRRGYLFYGPPGTGKTSISLALAGMFGLELYVLSLSEPSMTDQRLGNLFSALSARCVVLLEDVDAVGLNRNLGEDKAEGSVSKQDKSGSSDKTTITLSGLLNAIDGVASQEGRILVMTTNDPESLDRALIRPGRVDLQIYFGNINKENTRQIFERMYAPDEDEERFLSLSRQTTESADAKADGTDIKKEQTLQEMAMDFADAIPEETFTPAEVQGFLLTRRKDPRLALQQVYGWRDELLLVKARGKNAFKAKGKPPEINGPSLPETEVAVQINGSTPSTTEL